MLQTLGEDQWLPLAAANPTIGTVGTIEKVPEYKMEMFCEEVYFEQVISVMLDATLMKGLSMQCMQ